MHLLLKIVKLIDMNKLQQQISRYGQANLARDAQVSPSTVSRIMNGKVSGFGKSVAHRASKLLKLDLAITLGLEK